VDDADGRARQRRGAARLLLRLEIPPDAKINKEFDRADELAGDLRIGYDSGGQMPLSDVRLILNWPINLF